MVAIAVPVDDDPIVYAVTKFALDLDTHILIAAVGAACKCEFELAITR